jgi:hypothetical protein
MVLLTASVFTTVLNSPDYELWWSVYRDKIKNLHQNKTFELVDLPLPWVSSGSTRSSSVEMVPSIDVALNRPLEMSP